ncbi:MAG: PaaI family thioesterase [Hyphomonadaceae bacterium]|nr:PaaI family thioesterase [Hyphomonadaceae bacterium]
MISVSQAQKQVEALFDAREDFANPMRQIQGGYLCAMLDDVMSVACMITSGMTHVAPTLEMKTSFMRPALANGAKLRGVGRVVKWGRTIAFTEGEIWDADGKLLAKATGTAMPTPFANFKK